MVTRFLGNSCLKVSALAFGTMTFGGKGPFRQMGSVQVDEERRLVDLYLAAGVDATMAQTALNWVLRKPGVTSPEKEDGCG